MGHSVKGQQGVTVRVTIRDPTKVSQSHQVFSVGATVRHSVITVVNVRRIATILVYS